MSASAIEIQDLIYTYRDGTKALDGIGFDVGVGDTIGIVGANGAGKSTLALLLVGVLLPEHGLIKVDGIELRKKTVTEVRKRVGLVFQNPDDQLFMPTLFDDIAFGPLAAGLDEERAREIVSSRLEEVNLSGLEHKFTGHLSGGQKKAAAIAAVLANRPGILILDEPAAGLDPRGRRKLIDTMGSLDYTKLLISHDLEMILDLCPRVILLDKGKIITDGNPLEIFADHRLMEDHRLEVPSSLRRDHKHRFPMSEHPHD
jgi:cobalt/nickel transport system ATP-binding protein